MASRPTRRHWDVARLSRKCVSQKVGYKLRAEALDGAERAMEAGHVQPGCHLTPYLCEQCGEWHIRNRQIVDVPSGDVSRRHRARSL